jgi:orotate phosphoribosyltransferase-like protein|tara:strand:- start:1790 stop:1978 length:189 start_codon:yes stop_codon:yes gene_type:complete
MIDSDETIEKIRRDGNKGLTKHRAEMADELNVFRKHPYLRKVIKDFEERIKKLEFSKRDTGA